MKLRLERLYPYGLERVWWALTEPDALARWYMECPDFKPVIGTSFTLHEPDSRGWSGWLDCQVLESDHLSRLAYSTVERSSGQEALVSWSLTDAGPSGTRLVLDHSGLSGIQGRLIGGMLRLGWWRLLGRPFSRVLDGREDGS